MKTMLGLFCLGLIEVATVAPLSMSAANPLLIAIETGNAPSEIPPYYVDGFELRTNGIHTDLFWWSGAGRCGGEFPSQGKIRLLNVIGGNPALPVANCELHLSAGDPRSVARDDAYVYFAHPSGVRRQAVSATPADPASLLAPSNGRQMGGLTLANGRLFWSDYDGAVSRVYSMNPDGSDLRPLFSGNYPKVRSIVVDHYRVGLSFFNTLYLLHMDGRLNRFDYDTPGAQAVTLATGVSDFTFRDESIGSGAFTERFTSIYAIVASQKQLRSVRADAPSSFTIVTNAIGDIAFTSVAVDRTYLFLMEQPTPCSPFCVPIGFTLRRQARSVSNPDNSQPWLPIATGSGDTLARSNLRSDGRHVYWMAGNGIFQLDTGADPIELDLAALRLEVVQTTQDLNQGVRLVQNKPAVVRAYVRTSRNTANLRPLFPGAALRVRHFENELGTLSPINRPTVDETSDLNALRGQFDRSFVFEVPWNWMRAGTMTFDFTVNPQGALLETGSDGNTMTVSVPVTSGGRPCLEIVPIHSAAPDYDPLAPRSNFGSILARAKSLMPVEDITFHLHKEHISKPMVVHVEGREVVTQTLFDLASGEAEWNLALTQLGLSSILDRKACNDSHYLGTVPDKIGGSIGGLAPRPANTLLVRMDSEPGAAWETPQGGVNLAHELAHNYGRLHIDCGKPRSPDPNYPYPPDDISFGAALVGADRVLWGFDPVSRSVIDPFANADFMSYCQSWTSQYTWDALLDGFFGLRKARVAPSASKSFLNAPGPVLLLQGVVDLSVDSVNLLPFHQFPSGFIEEEKIEESLAAAAGASSPYSIRFLDGANGQLDLVPLVFVDVADAPGGDQRVFTQFTLVPAGTRRVQIIKGAAVRAERFVSASAPLLALAQPVLDASTHTLNVKWSASDPDHDPMFFTVQHSPDNGTTWRTLKVGHPGLSANLDTRYLPGGLQSLIRVIATDGFNTVSAVSGPFELPPNAPQPMIDGLQPGQRLRHGQIVNLNGMAFDAEDGTVADSRLNWMIAGPTPRTVSGSQVSLANLSPGLYTATLTATDTDDQIASSVINFQIEPLIVPDGSAPVLDGLCADAAYQSAASVTIVLPGARTALAHCIHAGTDLFVCFSDLPYSSPTGGVASIGFFVDTDWDRASAQETGDYGFFVNDSGTPVQTDAGVRILNPRPGFTAVVARGLQGWNAEFRIADSLVGGWNHGVGLLFRHAATGLAASHWPSQGDTNNPGTWAPAFFGTPPTPTNQPPVAFAGASRAIDLFAAEPVRLDGSASFDPQGQPLSYAWSQVSGPPVTLSSLNVADPVFTAAPSNAPATLRFQLRVSDGQLTSPPSQVEIVLRPGLVQELPLFSTSRINPVTRAFESDLPWSGQPGERAMVQATTNFLNWVDLSLSTVDFTRSIHLSDPAAAVLPFRFYRLRSMPVSTQLVYSNDFEATPVGNEWSFPRPITTTPAGGRRFLGEFGNVTKSLQLTNLPSHTRLRIIFELFILKSWDGNRTDFGPDRWMLSVRDGAVLVDTTFAQYPDVAQAYPGAFGASFPGLTGASERSTLGYTFGGLQTDTVYQLAASCDHTDSSVIFDFRGLNLQDVADESWGLDNIRVEAINAP